MLQRITYAEGKEEKSELKEIRIDDRNPVEEDKLRVENAEKLRQTTETYRMALAEIETGIEMLDKPEILKVSYLEKFKRTPRTQRYLFLGSVITLAGSSAFLFSWVLSDRRLEDKSDAYVGAVVAGGFASALSSFGTAIFHPQNTLGASKISDSDFRTLYNVHKNLGMTVNQHFGGICSEDVLKGLRKKHDELNKSIARQQVGQTAILIGIFRPKAVDQRSVLGRLFRSNPEVKESALGSLSQSPMFERNVVGEIFKFL